MTPYLYFASYARHDARRARPGVPSPLERVFEKLRDRVRAKAGINDEDAIKRIAFVDAQSIATGEEWEERLSDAAHHAQVLVCFVSPTYFNSEWCAKEFDLFRRRVEQRADVGTAPVIIPIIWEKCHLLQAVARFQCADVRLPDVYLKHGLSVLRNIKANQRYEGAAIEALAEMILEAARMMLPPLVPRIGFQALPRAFDNPGPYGIALVTIGPGGPHTAVGTIETVARVVDNVAFDLKIPWREVTVDPSLAQSVAAAARDRAIVVIVCDAKSAASEPHASHLASLAKSGTPLIVLVGVSAATPDPSAARAVASALGSDDRHAIECFSLANPREFSVKLSRMVTRRRIALIETDPPVRVADAEILREAELAGRDLSTRPGLIGPGREQ